MNSFRRVNIRINLKRHATDTEIEQHLKNNDRVEKYAREKYFMKRDNEDIYIIEFEDDKKAEKEAEVEKINSNK